MPTKTNSDIKAYLYPLIDSNSIHETKLDRLDLDLFLSEGDEIPNYFDPDYPLENIFFDEIDFSDEVEDDADEIDIVTIEIFEFFYHILFAKMKYYKFHLFYILNIKFDVVINFGDDQTIPQVEVKKKTIYIFSEFELFLKQLDIYLYVYIYLSLLNRFLFLFLLFMFIF